MGSETDIPKEACNAVEAYKRGGVRELDDYLAICRVFDREPDSAQLCEAGLAQVIVEDIVKAFDAKQSKSVRMLCIVVRRYGGADFVDRLIALALKRRADDHLSRGNTRSFKRFRDGSFNLVLTRSIAREVFDNRMRHTPTILPQSVSLV